MIRTIGLLLALGLAATGAPAQGPQDPMEVCYHEADGPVRLACFNAEMQRRHAATASGTKREEDIPMHPAPPADAAAVQKRAQENAGLEGKELRRKLKEEGVAVEAVKPIVATITRLLPRPNNEYAFVLDNGQIWEQSEVKADLYVNPHEPVTIKPGVLGSFYLTTSKSQRIRVHRIR
jgi:hypothetical protein